MYHILIIGGHGQKKKKIMISKEYHVYTILLYFDSWENAI